MKKGIFFKVVYALAFLLIFANTVISAVQSLNPDIDDLPVCRLIDSCDSPNGSSRIDVYLVSNSLGNAVRCDYVTGETHTNIYWQTNSDKAEVKWLSERSITINNVPLNVKTDKFDSRRGTAIFSEGVLAENINDND